MIKHSMLQRVIVKSCSEMTYNTHRYQQSGVCGLDCGHGLEHDNVDEYCHAAVV